MVVWGEGGRGGGGEKGKKGRYVGAEKEPCGFGAWEDDFFFPPVLLLLFVPQTDRGHDFRGWL